MIALDTNVLVRFLVEDDPEQSRQAKALLERAIAANSACFVSEVVVCEVVWVLGTSYQVGREDIARVLRQPLRARHLTFPEGERLSRALSAFDSGRGDFADYLIREAAREAGCEAVATFDRGLLRETGFVAPSLAQLATHRRAPLLLPSSRSSRRRQLAEHERPMGVRGIEVVR